MELVAEPLTAEAFAPYGEVIAVPESPGRNYYEEALGNLRPAAKPSLSVACRPPYIGASIGVELLERHEFSSQTFVPVEAGRWLIIVCPHAAGGGPDAAKSRAFVATARQGVTYRPNTWHHGMTVLDKPGTFAVFMWRDGGKGDEEFVPVPKFTVKID